MRECAESILEFLQDALALRDHGLGGIGFSHLPEMQERKTGQNDQTRHTNGINSGEEGVDNSKTYLDKKYNP